MHDDKRQQAIQQRGEQQPALWRQALQFGTPTEVLSTES
jgi:hypothetical protein